MTASSPGHASHKGGRDSLFDAHHAPSRPLIDDCVHCGFCLPACPTYLLWGKETGSPRGRIHLMKLGLQGEVTMSDAFVSHFDSCLGCMACVTACPSGVQYDRLIDATRPQLERHGGRAFKERLFRRVLFEIFPYPNRLRALAGPLWLYQRSGLQRPDEGDRTAHAASGQVARDGRLAALHLPPCGALPAARAVARAGTEAAESGSVARVRPAHLLRRRERREPRACWPPRAAT